MSDPYPEHLTIEFDRATLTRYLRVKWLLAWQWLAVLAPLLSSGSLRQIAENGPPPGTDALTAVLRIIATYAAAGSLLGLGIYLLLSHWLAPRLAHCLHVTVEGAYLRIRDGLLIRTDRKLHFRSIIDYATLQGPLMRRFGLHALQVTTQVPLTPQTPRIFLPAVKNCLATRDLLSEIDRLREHR